MLGTYSVNIALPATRREEVLGRIRARIAGRPGSTAARHYLAVLGSGRRVTKP